MMAVAADRGGPVDHLQRRGMNVAPEGCRATIESSPVRGRARVIAAMALVMAIAGAMSLGHGAYLRTKAVVAQVLLRVAWDRARAGVPMPRPWPWADTHVVARLVAPGHDVNLLVLAGANGRTLAFGPGHHDGSAAPGEPGNVVLTGHRDTHFRFLHALAVGDVLELETPAGVHRRYRVTGAAVVDYRDIALPRAPSRLTLITCYPFAALAPGGPLRYVVTAALEPASGERQPQAGNTELAVVALPGLAGGDGPRVGDGAGGDDLTRRERRRLGLPGDHASQMQQRV